MADDVHVTHLDVVKQYNVKLNHFRGAAIACGVLIDKQIRKIQSELERKKTDAQYVQRQAVGKRDDIVQRYKPIRSNSYPGSECAGTTDSQIQAKYQALEAAVEDYNRSLGQIRDKMAEIGQQTKTFCTILDSEVIGCNQKLKGMIAIMDSMTNMHM
jgi:uncharacterized protein YukE